MRRATRPLAGEIRELNGRAGLPCADEEAQKEMKQRRLFSKATAGPSRLLGATLLGSRLPGPCALGLG